MEKIQKYPILQQRLTDAGLLDLHALLHSQANDWKEDVLSTATDRFERRLSEELGGLRVEIASINVRVADVQNTLLRWLFGFVITVIAANVGMITLLVNALKP
jgi:hypothetical protein